VLYRKDSQGVEEVFLDPNSFSEDGTISLSDISFSKDGSVAAYAISEGGSDWRKVFFLDTETKSLLSDSLINVKFSSLSWKNNEGIYYSTYDAPEGSELSSLNNNHKLYFHKLGTTQKKDQIIFGNNAEQKRRYVSSSVTEDQNYLIISAANSTSGNELYLINHLDENPEIKTINDDLSIDVYLLDSLDEELFLVTNNNADNQKIISVQATEPSLDNSKDLIPEQDSVMSPSSSGGYIFVELMQNAISKTFQYDFSGKLIREVDLPGIGSVSPISGKRDDDELFYSFSNYHTPPTIYSINPESGKSKIYFKPKINFDPEKYISEQVFYTSKDGTKVPMIITHKKGLSKNGKNPTILYGYGGFNISLTPNFSSIMAYWLEKGGVYAVPNIRGGGEYGKKWHLSGTKMNKQNVFDDFIYAARFLFSGGYTKSENLILRGGSNGGLLVGAVMTQEPQLARVALPAVGVLDMLRYHKFTAGAGWAYDYGTSDESEEMFNYLLSYSPLHNIKDEVSYPATLITTGDHDDRVVPAHSYKFAAALQELHSGDNPILIRIETEAGHGAGTPTEIILDSYSEIFSFILGNIENRLSIK
jgi:prolyl oligopeptidase